MSAQPHFTHSAPSLAAWIASSRQLLGLTQQQFASRIDAHWVSVSKWERGQTQPGRKAIAKIEALLRERPGSDWIVPTDPLSEWTTRSAESSERWQEVLRRAYFGDAATEEANVTAPDKLNAARDDLADALGLLIALNHLASENGTDGNQAIASVARCASEKVRAAYRIVSDVWEV